MAQLSDSSFLRQVLDTYRTLENDSRPFTVNIRTTYHNFISATKQPRTNRATVLEEVHPAYTGEPGV